MPQLQAQIWKETAHGFFSKVQQVQRNPYTFIKRQKRNLGLWAKELNRNKLRVFCERLCVLPMYSDTIYEMLCFGISQDNLRPVR